LRILQADYWRRTSLNIAKTLPNSNSRSGRGSAAAGSGDRKRDTTPASLVPPYTELRSGDTPQLHVLTHLVSFDAPTAAISSPPVVVSTSIYDVEQPEYRYDARALLKPFGTSSQRLDGFYETHADSGPHQSCSRYTTDGTECSRLCWREECF
jgi:hypothetical protein